MNSTCKEMKLKYVGGALYAKNRSATVLESISILKKIIRIIVCFIAEYTSQIGHKVEYPKRQLHKY